MSGLISTALARLKAAMAAPYGSAIIGFIQSGIGARFRTAQDKLRETLSSEDYFLAGEADSTGQLQRAIDAAMAAGKRRVVMNTPHTLSERVVIASNANPLIVDGQGNSVVLSNSVAGFTIKGMHHTLRSMEFTQASDALMATAVKVTADVNFPNTQHTRLEYLRGKNIYRGVDASMPGSSTVCYRTRVIECDWENFYNQKKWAGSFGVSFSGPVSGDAAGNDSKVIGGIIKGYENNVIVQNSVATEIIGVSIDGGAVAIRYDGGSEMKVIGGYIEYNTTIFEMLNMPYGLTVLGPTVANYEKYAIGNIFPGTFRGDEPLGGFVGGSVDMVSGSWNSKGSAGVVESYAVNGVSIGALDKITQCAPIRGVFSRTATVSFGNIAVGGSATNNLQIPGVTPNSAVIVTAMNGSLPNALLHFFGSPGVDTVSVFCTNPGAIVLTANDVQLRIVVMAF